MGLKTICVGVDRSDVAANALQWALDLAKSADAEVQAIATWQMPLIAALPGSIEGLPTADVMANQCAEMLAGVVADHGGNTVHQVVVQGSPGPSLTTAASEGDLLVVGRTGQGKRRGFARFIEIALGSTARHCIHHAAGPVVTIPEGAQWSEPATVVVGIDGSDSSLSALKWSLTSLPATSTVHAVRAFAPWVGDGLMPMELVNDEAVLGAIRFETQQWVDAVVEGLGTDSSTAPPTVEVVVGSARDALPDPGYDVDLIVVGERGHTGVAAKVLGSISDHLVRYAPCPVVVVPDMADENTAE